MQNVSPGGAATGTQLAAVPPRAPEKRARSKWLVVWIVFALIAALTIYWERRIESAQAAKGEGISVPVTIVSTGDVTATVRAVGTVAATRSASLLAPRILGSRSGMNRGGDANFGGGGGGGGADFNLVLLTLAKAGTHVKTGDVVAQFDPQNQLQRLEDYKDTVVQLENSIKGMKANLASIKEAHDQSVRTAKANWDNAVLDLDTAPVHSQIDVEKLKLAVEEAQATYKQLVFEASLVDESQRAQMAVSQLNLDQSKIELQRAQANVEKMTIKAPMDGTVVMASIVRNGEFGTVREGDQVNAGQPFLSIVDPSSMVLEAAINQVDAERLRLGAAAEIRIDAYPAVALPGTLAGIGAMSKTSTFRATYVGEIPIRIQLNKLDPHVIPELTGSAEIVLKTEKDAVLAPRASILEEGAAKYVFVEDHGTWARRPVEVGLESNTAIAIRSGLKAGEAIAAQPAILAKALK